MAVMHMPFAARRDHQLEILGFEDAELDPHRLCDLLKAQDFGNFGFVGR